MPDFFEDFADDHEGDCTILLMGFIGLLIFLVLTGLALTIIASITGGFVESP